MLSHAGVLVPLWMARLRALGRVLPHVSAGWRLGFQLLTWGVAVVWCVRTRALMERFGEVPDLSEVGWDLCPAGAPGLVVVVPARDEAWTIEPAIRTLMAQDYPWLRVFAVDDRSVDGTGEILDRVLAEHPERMAVLHLTESAEGWMGKTFAMETAARQSRSEWVLFTDADVWFSPSILRRALAYGEIAGADHLVVAPTPVIRGWGESVLLGFFSVLALWATRPWRVRDPKATWDMAGVGAFNMMRREAWEELGGFGPQRLAVVEDLTLGKRVRAAGMRQRLVFAPGLVLVHWATGMRGLVRGMTKNLFAAAGFRWVGSLAFLGVVGTLFLLPVAGLAWWPTLLPCVITLACVGVHYRVLSEVTGIEARWGWLFPVGAVAMLWAMVRSAVLTTVRGGVRWRETFYPVREMRAFNNPFAWEMEAAKARAEQRRRARGARRGGWLRVRDAVRRRGGGR